MPDKKFKILMIDDDKGICDLVKEYFQLTGKYKVLLASEGDIGIRLAFLRWHKPHIVLLDLSMPGIDGFEVLRRLRNDKETSYIPVVILTGRSDYASQIKAEGLYCDDYIVKPVDLNVLKSRIEKVLAKRGIAADNIEESKKDNKNNEEA